MLILYALLTPLFALVMLVIFKEIVSYWNLRFYKAQGIETHYIPFFGAQYLFRAINHSSDPLKNSKILAKQVSKNDRGIVAYNSLFGLEPILILANNDIISDFYRAEVENFSRRKIAPDGIQSKNGFFYNGGIHSLQSRTHFAEFFSYDNMLKMMIPVVKIFYRRFNAIRDTINPDNSSKWLEVEITSVLQKGFDDVINEIVFGDASLSNTPTIEGYNFSTFVEKFVHNLNSVAKNPLSWMTLGLSHKLRLLKYSRDAARMKDLIFSKILDIYRKRLQDGPKEAINLIDLMIAANQKAVLLDRKNEILTEEDIVENIIVFYLAGTDTSKSLAASSIYVLASTPELSESLFKSIKQDIFSGDLSTLRESSALQLDSSELLNRFIKESLRRYGPATWLFFRTAQRNVKIGGVKIKKGTDLTILSNGVHHLDNAFPDSLKFNVDRWLPENAKSIPKWMYAPFTLGKRNCLGQYFGEHLVKAILVIMLSLFKIKEAENFEPKWSAVFGLEMDSTKVRVKPRHN